jgi:hypothetical protein
MLDVAEMVWQLRGSMKMKLCGKEDLSGDRLT